MVFRSEYEHKIEYEHDFRIQISDVSRDQEALGMRLVCDNVKPANWTLKVLLARHRTHMNPKNTTCPSEMT